MIKDSDILDASILIVDDQEANVTLLERMLAFAGYTNVSSTRDPREVCGLHRRHKYRLILLDLQMPGMDGFEVLEGLKDMAQDDYLPVLVVTAQPGHKLRALHAGAKDFVSKPFDLAEVQMRVRNMLEVRLLHLESRRHGAVLEQTLREVEASREVLPDAIAVRPDAEIRPLAAAFLANRHRDVEALRAGLAARDFHALRMLGHTIKETGRGYGFEGLTEIGSAIERAAHHEDRDAVDTRITHLAQYLQRVRVME